MERLIPKLIKFNVNFCKILLSFAKVFIQISRNSSCNIMYKMLLNSKNRMKRRKIITIIQE